MHILLIHQAFASLAEPGGTRHFEMAQALLSRGHRVTIIASPVSYITGSRSENLDRPAGESPPAGLTILRARVYEAHHKSFFHRLLAFFSFMFSSFWLGWQVRGVDLVWGTSPPIFQAVTAWLLARLKRAPFMLEVRDLWPEFAIAVGVLRDRILIQLSEWLERMLYRGADCVVVNSPGFLEHVRLRGASRVELVPNGADPSMFAASTSPQAFRREHGFADRFVALYAGAHGMSNDLEVVVEAARLLQDAKVQVVLVGDGKEKPALLARAAGLPNITFLDPVPKRRMPEILAAVDAGIAILKPIPAYTTTYPNKVFDYMAAGLPVVLAIDGVIRAVVEAAGCGLFATPGDSQALAGAIRLLAADEERARSMGLAGKRYLERHFNREHIARKLIAVVESIAAPSRQPG